MGSLFSPPSPPPLPPPVPLPPPPELPPPPPTPEDPAVDEARKKLRQSQLRRKGRRATILTSGLGDTGTAPIRRPNLHNTLGGT